MSKVSFTEIKQSQLPYLNIVDGQIICCTDSGNIYKDNGTKRKQLSKYIEFVDTLPLAPLSDTLYLLKPSSLYVYDDGWISLINSDLSDYVTKDNIKNIVNEIISDTEPKGQSVDDYWIIEN